MTPETPPKKEFNINHAHPAKWRKNLYIIIFGTHTPAGKNFDVILLIAIVLSIAVVFLESVESLEEKFGPAFRIAEWVFTVIFTIEYLTRIIASKKPMRYIFSFYGIVDFLSIIPTYLSLILVGSQYLLVIRTLRLMRVFRVLKLDQFMGESSMIGKALFASRRKILVFLWAVVIIVVIMGTIMYVVEDAESGFTSIPKGIYWAIVTLTTVGYGDIAPQTVLGQALASVIMILGYAIIAVPTGIVTAEMSNQERTRTANRLCNNCNTQDHDNSATYCKHCGHKL